MFVSCDELNCVYERRPGLALLSEHAPALRRDFVEATASLFRLFNPGPLDPSTLLEAIQQWIEGIEVKRDLAAGARVDQFTQLISVAGPRVEQRKDEQLRGPPLQLTIERSGVTICHEQIVYRQAS
jgi:hypothetical protein